MTVVALLFCLSCSLSSDPAGAEPSSPTAQATAPRSAAASAASVGAFDHDHAAFAAFLKGAVDPGGVDYRALASRRDALDAYLATLAEIDATALEPSQRLAFWVNAYNAATISLVLDHPDLRSMKDLDDGQVWKRRTFDIGGESLTLDALEHERIRKIADGRIHAVLSCAARGCPPLPAEPLRADSLDAQLTRASQVWVQTNAFELRDGTVYLSEIFKWFPGDFADYRKAPIPGTNEAQTRGLWFIATFAEGGVAAQLTDGVYPVAWESYDWALNRAGGVPKDEASGR